MYRWVDPSTSGKREPHPGHCWRLSPIGQILPAGGARSDVDVMAICLAPSGERRQSLTCSVLGSDPIKYPVSFNRSLPLPAVRSTRTGSDPVRRIGGEFRRRGFMQRGGRDIVQRGAVA